jgi:hypothetical protein
MPNTQITAADAISHENDTLSSMIQSGMDSVRTLEQRYMHQAQSHNTVKMINYILLFMYSFFFVLIHVLFAEQYLSGVPRNEIVDSIFLTVFFLYPYLIYSIEGYIYDVVMYIWASIYARTKIPSFDTILLKSDYYEPPATSFS